MSETLRSPLSFLSGRWPILLLRLALGGPFTASSLSKLEYPGQFSGSALSYQMLPGALARPFATILRLVGLFIGCSLVLGIFVVFACALIVPLILSLAMAVVGVKKSPPAEGTDTALGESRIALVFRFGGDAGAMSDDLVVLSDVRCRFAETVCVD